VGQFMRYIVKTNFRVEQHARRTRRKNPQIQVVVINKKLDEMAQWMLHSHSDTLMMLAKIEEIKGLLVDLIS